MANEIVPSFLIFLVDFSTADPTWGDVSNAVSKLKALSSNVSFH